MDTVDHLQTALLCIVETRAHEFSAELGLTGYNLVRAVMNAVAEEHNLNPRRLSFWRSQDVVNSALPGLAAATTEAEYQAGLMTICELSYGSPRKRVALD